VTFASYCRLAGFRRGFRPADRPEPTRLGEVVWLEPYPDTFLEGADDGAPGPEARYEQAEAVSLAFVTALQVDLVVPAADLAADTTARSGETVFIHFVDVE